jgi:hypothetical protein
VVMTVPYATAATPLAPIVAILDSMRARYGDAPVHGLEPDLLVSDTDGWLPATALTSGAAVSEMLHAAIHRWNAPIHTAVALAWKAYTYWVALPAVLGYASARRVPLPHPSNVLLRYSDHRPFLHFGLLQPTVAVLPGDPVARTGSGDELVVRNEDALLRELRSALLDEHLDPLLDQIRGRVNVGRRMMLGSLASGVCWALARAAHALPGSAIESADAILTALGVDDLVEVTRDPATGAISVQRRTCCLAFNLPTPRICAGCCIRPT